MTKYVEHTNAPSPQHQRARTQPQDATQMRAREMACERSGVEHRDGAGEHERAVAVMREPM